MNLFITEADIGGMLLIFMLIVMSMKSIKVERKGYKDVVRRMTDFAASGFAAGMSSASKRNMTRKEMVEYCSLCVNRKMDEEKGLVCGLTNEYADFEGQCENFKGDEHEIEERNLRKRQENSKTIIAVLCVIIALIWIPAIFYMINEPYAGGMFVLLSSVTGTLSALFSVFWVLKAVRFNKNNGGLTLDRIMDCVRKEGYYPQKQDENMVRFKIHGETLEIYYYKDIRYFRLLKIYQIDEEDLRAAEQAAFATMVSVQLVKILTYRSDGCNYLIFSVETKGLSSSDFETFFPNYISIISDSIQEHRKYFKLISEKQAGDKASGLPIGFPLDTSKIKN